MQTSLYTVYQYTTAENTVNNVKAENATDLNNIADWIRHRICSPTCRTVFQDTSSFSYTYYILYHI